MKHEHPAFLPDLGPHVAMDSYGADPAKNIVMVGTGTPTGLAGVPTRFEPPQAVTLFILSSTSITSFTAFALALQSSCSSLVSFNSRIRSMPLRPRMTGTPM